MIGTRLGPYEITAKLGEGGMGEVYRATDSNLKRDVAIKVLPGAFIEDKARLDRFAREAQILAQLHHPHIASIFGLETVGGVRGLVMELVEGPTLAEKLAGGALPIDEALPIARQIALALEAAHDKGIIHRDLKPQNVKLTPDGEVKVLDFGLAKAMDPGGASGAASPMASPTMMSSPTLTAMQGTQLGVILGTAAYMAPEQARGQAVDKRADIWAFGVVLYEMLGGAKLFASETVSDTLAAVIRKEVDLDELPDGTPAAIRRLLRRCLERDPKNRLRDIGDVRIEIEDALSGGVEEEAVPSTAPPARSLGWALLPWLLVAGLAGLLFSRIGFAPEEPDPEPRRAFEISVPLGNLLEEGAGLAFAPDGSAIAFTAVDPLRGPELWLRRTDRFDPVRLHGTAGASFPFWSPDSQSIGFFRDSDGTLLRYVLATGTVDVLAKLATGVVGRGASWATADTILLAPSSNSPIQRLHISSGVIEDITDLDPAILDGSHRFPVALPDGRHFLFTLWSNQLETAERVGGIYLASFEKGVERRLAPDLSQAVLAGDDRILIRRDGALVALPFDPIKLEILGGGERLGEEPLYASASGALAASAAGTGDVAFALASDDSGGQLVWLDRAGEVVGSIGSERLGIRNLALAPDSIRYAAEVLSASGSNIWVGDDRRRVMNRLTPDAIDSYRPVWSPDGRQITFVSEAEGSLGLYIQDADGSSSAQLLLGDQQRDFEATDWSADGRFLILESSVKVESRTEIWLYDFEDGAARELLVERSATLSGATLSEDGRWLAYVSDESGNPEIFVRPFPDLDRKWKISQGGATSPYWSQEGRELLFVGLTDQAVQVVDIAADRDGLRVGNRRQLFVPRSRLLGFAPAPDHSRFLAGVLPSNVLSQPIRVILGWRRPSAPEGSP